MKECAPRAFSRFTIRCALDEGNSWAVVSRLSTFVLSEKWKEIVVAGSQYTSYSHNKSCVSLTYLAPPSPITRHGWIHLVDSFYSWLFLSLQWPREFMRDWCPYSSLNLHLIPFQLWEYSSLFSPSIDFLLRSWDPVQATQWERSISIGGKTQSELPLLFRKAAKASLCTLTHRKRE